jgi:hypothetical protein
MPSSTDSARTAFSFLAREPSIELQDRRALLVELLL